MTLERVSVVASETTAHNSSCVAGEPGLVIAVRIYLYGGEIITASAVLQSHVLCGAPVLFHTEDKYHLFRIVKP